MFAKYSSKSLIGCAVLAVLGVALSNTVYAQQRTGMTDQSMMTQIRPYIGANYGLYQEDVGDFDTDQDMWEVYAGAMWNNYLGLEASWTSLATMDTADVDLSIDGWGLAAVGQYPFQLGINVYGKLGVLFWDADFDTDDLSQAFDGNEVFVTLGGGYDMSRVMDIPLTLTLEYTRYNVDIEPLDAAGDTDVGGIDSVKLGLRFMF